MSYVAINVLSVPEGQGETLEGRFAGRAGMVEHSEGFESFELLRPSSGTADYLVITHWRDEASYRAWLDSREFTSGHAGPGRGGESGPAASGSQIWTFETVQSAGR
jgi:heme-degrading monooxygenase HmoA